MALSRSIGTDLPTRFCDNRRVWRTRPLVLGLIWWVSTLGLAGVAISDGPGEDAAAGELAGLLVGALGPIEGEGLRLPDESLILGNILGDEGLSLNLQGLGLLRTEGSGLSLATVLDTALVPATEAMLSQIGALKDCDGLAKSFRGVLDESFDPFEGLLGDVGRSGRLQSLLGPTSRALGERLPGFTLGVDFDDLDAEVRLAAVFSQRVGCLSTTREGCARPVDLRVGVELDAIDLQLRASILGLKDAGSESASPLHAYWETTWREQVDAIEPDEWSTRWVLEANRVSRVALSVEYVSSGDFDAPLEDAGLDLDLEPVGRWVGVLRVSRPLAPGRVVKGVARVDVALSFEDRVENRVEDRDRDRWLAELTLTRRLADHFSLLFTTEWASQPEYLRQAEDILSGRLAVRWKLRDRWLGGQ